MTIPKRRTSGAARFSKSTRPINRVGSTSLPTTRACPPTCNARCANGDLPRTSSHIAFGSIRMEPVFMILGQSTATAAVMAIDAGQSVQEVPYARLRERLLADGQVLAVDK